MRITEGEIHYIIRQYMLQNDFQLFTKTTNGIPLHYRTNLKSPPQFKQPDLVAIKSDTVLVFEEKIWYNNLFNRKDVDKLTNFLNNPIAVREFKQLIRKTMPSITKPKLYGVLASLEPKRLQHKPIPANLLYVGIKLAGHSTTVSIQQDLGLRQLFTKPTCTIPI